MAGKTTIIQGTSIRSYKNYGSIGPSMIPTILSTNEPKIIMSEIPGTDNNIDVSTPSAFNDTLMPTAPCVLSSVGGLRRELVPNFILQSPLIGDGEELDMNSTFNDTSNIDTVAVNPDLSSGLQVRYLRPRTNDNIRNNGSIPVFGSLSSGLMVYSGVKGVSSILIAGLDQATQNHFEGETKITDIIDFSASSCRGYIDGDTQNLTMLTSTGSFHATDIENTSFTDNTQKELMYNSLTDTSIVDTLSILQTGSINNEGLLVNERFATSGFVYETSELGPDNKGTDSITYGGWIK